MVETDPIYYLVFYITLFSMFLTLCIAATWNLVKLYFENEKTKQLLAFLQDYIDGNISDKELVHKTLTLYKPRKGDKLMPKELLIDEKEAVVLLNALDQIVDRHKADDIKQMEYKIYRFLNKEKSQLATADK